MANQSSIASPAPVILAYIRPTTDKAMKMEMTPLITMNASTLDFHGSGLQVIGTSISTDDIVGDGVETGKDRPEASTSSCLSLRG
jgi:hypothetical protein